MIEADTLWQLVQRRAEATPDALFALDEEERELSFDALRQQAECTAAGLLALGVREGTPVSWILPTRLSAFVLMAALARLGAVQNPLVPIYRRREIEFCLRQTAARWLLVPGVFRGFDFGELARDLAVEFPDYEFIAIGKARTESLDYKLRRHYGDLPNFQLLGFIDQFASPRLFELLSSSWVLVNTALREGLPRSFMEAAACGCAILSHVDPDGFASRFGFRAERDNFAEGLQWLLDEDRWRVLGQDAHDYVAGTYELSAAVTAHVDVYMRMVGDQVMPA